MLKKKKIRIKQKEQNLQVLVKEHKKLLTQSERLYSEIADSLLGKSAFTPIQLSSAIEELNVKIDVSQANLNNIKNEIERNNFSDVDYPSNELINWEQKFENADDNLKKAMLSRIIEKVYFSKGEIKIELNIMIKEILNI